MQPDERGNHGEAVGDPVIDFREQHLGLVAGLREIDGAILDALLQGRIQRLHLVPGLGDLARITVDGENDSAHDQR